MNQISITSISIHFKGVRALTDVSATMESGEITTILGPNGAGKTTLLNAISGVYQADTGKVALGGEDFTNTPMYYRARMGIRRTFQHVQLVPSLTVLQNVMIGALEPQDVNLLSALLLPGKHKRKMGVIREKTEQVLKRLDIFPFVDKKVADLPFGVLRMVEIARVLVANPRVILMDEPAAGLSLDGRSELLSVLKQLKKENITIALVEHNLDFVFQVSDRIIVLERGFKIFDGTPDAVKQDQRVKEAYLG